MKPFEFRNFDYTGWKRPGHTVIRDSVIKNNLYEKGIHIIPGFINQEEVKQLHAIYDVHHSIQAPGGGFFISVNSANLGYRNAIHNLIRDILEKKFETVFQNHKHTCFSFFVKYPGAKGELLVHQDMAQVDEFEYSQVGIWMPLQDVSVENGTLGVLPYSHFTIPPHRTLYHQLPFSKIYPTAFRYIQPLELKAGDLVLFDIRLLHNSFVNLTDKPRVAIASSVVPAQAPFSICYRDGAATQTETGDNEYEFIGVDDNFFLEFKDFKSEKVFRPDGSASKKVIIKERFVDEDEFLTFCRMHNLRPHENKSFFTEVGNNPIQEPDHREQLTEHTEEQHTPPARKKTLLERFKQLAGING